MLKYLNCKTLILFVGIAVFMTSCQKGPLESSETINNIGTPDSMVYIPGGSFSMGMPNGNTGDIPHQVTVASFYMSNSEVTQKNYLSIVGNIPFNVLDTTYSPLHPVEDVTWFDAVLYCNKRTKLSGNLDTVYRYGGIPFMDGLICTLLVDIIIDTSKNGYRLPTEAEWEYAARAGNTGEYWWTGKSGYTIDNCAWYEDNSNHKSHSVGTKNPNPYGLYDMNGNVEEWCNDMYDWYPTSAEVNPIILSGGYGRILRGGRYRSSALSCTSDSRFFWFAKQGLFTGIRVARSAR